MKKETENTLIVIFGTLLVILIVCYFNFIISILFPQKPTEKEKQLCEIVGNSIFENVFIQTRFLSENQYKDKYGKFINDNWKLCVRDLFKDINRADLNSDEIKHLKSYLEKYNENLKIIENKSFEMGIYLNDFDKEQLANIYTADKENIDIVSKFEMRNLSASNMKKFCSALEMKKCWEYVKFVEKK